MKAKDLCLAIGDIREDYIEQAHDGYRRTTVWYRLTAVAACFLVIASAALLVRRHAVPQEHSPANAEKLLASDIAVEDAAMETGTVETETLTVNWTDNIASADMDVAGYTEWLGSSDMLPEEAFGKFLGIEYDVFLQRIPEDWALTEFSVVTAPDYAFEDKMRKPYIPHDFVLRFSTESGGELRIAVCGTEEPLRCVIYMTDDPLQSTINGHPVTVYGNENYFSVICADSELYFDIETKNITLEELRTLLCSLLQPAE